MQPSAAALVALAEVNCAAVRSALIGTPPLLDCLIVCPGQHRLHDAPNLSKGEYPACAAMTTGYVFRVENEATVYQLQRWGIAGHLTTLKVYSDTGRTNKMDVLGTASLCYLAAASSTLGAAFILWALRDVIALVSLTMLISIRTMNVATFRNRAKVGWKGAQEPGVQGDLLVLLSGDRWIRIQGLVDDIKVVTSGQWLRDMTPIETSQVSLATLLAYLHPALGLGATIQGQLVLVLLLFVSAGLLGISNQRLACFSMHGCYIEMATAPQPYARRLDLAKQLIKETKREDWAIRLGMVQPTKESDMKESSLGSKIM